MADRYRPKTPTLDAVAFPMPKQPKHAYVRANKVIGRASIKQSTIKRVVQEGKQLRKSATGDSFQNFALNLGIGTNNALSQSLYGFYPITRVRTLLDWIHRGSWIGGIAVDLLADDMTRGGVEILTIEDPQQVEKLQQGIVRLKIWQKLCSTIKWAQLYGGCLAVLLIDGQKPETPLRIDTVTKNQFKGLMVLDRWMVDPDLQHLVADFGPHLGEPEWYRVVADAPAMRNQSIHYTRVIRLLGIELPYWQCIMENLWGLSVFERIYDRMVAFDSATTGAAQLVYKSYLRTYKMDGLHEAATAAGDALIGISQRVEMMRKYQSIEGITLLDSKDDFADTGGAASSFSGIADLMLHFAEQLSGSLQVPLVRLLGQSPAGLNSTGESDLRTYYDNILKRQEHELREGMNVVLRVLANSLAVKLPDEFNFNFVPLWQLDETEKADVADKTTRMVLETQVGGLVSEKVALQELRQLARVTGRWTNIDDKLIAEANDVAEPPEAEMGAEGGEEGEEAPEGEEGKQPPAEGKGSSAAELKGLESFKKIRRAVGGGGDRAYDAYSVPYSEIAGLQVVIEQRAGSIRSGEGWSVVMPADYGYVRRVDSAEGPQEWLDCFCGPNHSSRDVWVVDAVNPETGDFDEHKVLLGFHNSREALDCFRKAYDDGAARRIGAVTHFSMDESRWKNWLASGDKKRPLAMDRQLRVA
jgi:uncharacterized protein